MPKGWDDPGRELDWCGVYRLGADGKLTLLTKEMTRPNGIAFSPDFKTLYVAQSDPAAAIVKKFPVKEDGTLGEGQVVLDTTDKVNDENPGLPDGMAVDAKGNVWATGPGGVWILDPAGKPLGRIFTGERTSNCTFGGPNGTTLYLTVDDYIARIETSTTGAAN
jgi:gluconolactonase